MEAKDTNSLVTTNDVVISSEKLLYSSSLSEKLIVIMFITTQPSKPHILRLSIVVVNENKMLILCILFFKLVNKYSQTTSLISVPNLTYPTH